MVVPVTSFEDITAQGLSSAGSSIVLSAIRGSKLKVSGVLTNDTMIAPGNAAFPHASTQVAGSSLEK